MRGYPALAIDVRVVAHPQVVVSGRTPQLGGLRRRVVQSRPSVPGIRSAAATRPDAGVLTSAPPGVLIGAIAASWTGTGTSDTAQPVRGPEMVSQAPRIATGPTRRHDEPVQPLHLPAPVRPVRLRTEAAEDACRRVGACQLDSEAVRPARPGRPVDQALSALRANQRPWYRHRRRASARPARHSLRPAHPDIARYPDQHTLPTITRSIERESRSLRESRGGEGRLTESGMVLWVS